MGMITGSQVRRMAVANCEPAENSHFSLGFAGSQKSGCEPSPKTADFCGVRRFAGSHPYRGIALGANPKGRSAKETEMTETHVLDCDDIDDLDEINGAYQLALVWCETHEDYEWHSVPRDNIRNGGYFETTSKPVFS